MITAKVHEIIRNNPDIILEGIKYELRNQASYAKSRVNDAINIAMDGIEIHVPIINIYDSNGKSSDIAGRIAGAFKEDGYNAVTVNISGKSVAGTLDITDYQMEGTKDLARGFKTLYSVYDPDLIIIGTNSLAEIEELRTNFEIDIMVINNNNDTDEIWKRRRSIGSGRLIVVSDTLEEFRGSDIIVLRNSGEETTINLFKSIKDLFDRDW